VAPNESPPSSSRDDSSESSDSSSSSDDSETPSGGDDSKSKAERAEEAKRAKEAQKAEKAEVDGAGTAEAPRGLKRSKSAQTVTAVPPVTPNGVEGSKKRRRSDGGGAAQPHTPFKRVREESVKYADDRLRDNTFFSKGDTYGVRAHQDLSVTRGKGFRKAMTKKKRQSHHGGTLDAGNVSSYKFSDSDSD
jgi:hypothetical protein